MVSKNLVKYIKSLELKKYRLRERAFVAEGPKVVDDLLTAFSAKIIVTTEEWLAKGRDVGDAQVYVTRGDELRKVSFLQHPQQVTAVFEIPNRKNILPAEVAETQLVLALDNIQDPGNLGTIIRIADWFGIDNIVCNTGTADAFSPKVVQATMGSLARVHIYETNLYEWLSDLSQQVTVYGTLLDGKNIYEEPLDSKGVIIMGNEGNGISMEVREKVNHKLFIPNYSAKESTAESLNVAIATAITCAEFRRRMAYQ